MEFEYFLKNNELLPIKEAVVPVLSIEYQYGFGVYETIRVSNRKIFFLDDHIERLMTSTKIIELGHHFSPESIKDGITRLVESTKTPSFNIKILLIGGENATLYAMCFNPMFPDKKLYRDGAPLSTAHYERVYPHAKTLNMLQSYMAYRNAKKIGAYDALLINRDGFITEGTRTNFFCISNKTIYTPPEKNILLGVTRKAILKVATTNGYTLEEKNISLNDIENYEGAFISSTSSKIIPIKSIDGKDLKEAPEKLRLLMKLFDDFLDTCNGKI